MILTGLAVFPLVPLTTGFGAVVGGVVGEALHRVTEAKVKGQGATTIPLGCAALILAYPRSSAGTVEPVVARAVMKVTAEGSGHHVQALREALVGAQQQLAATGS